MKLKSTLLFLFLSLHFYSQNQSELKCLIGDCDNGYGIAQQSNGTFRQGFFLNGSPTGMEMIMGKGFMLVNIYKPEELFSVRFGMFKKGDDIVITNNTKHYGLEFNLKKRFFNKITLDNQNQKTTSRTPLKNNNINKGCVKGDCENGFGIYVYEGGSYAAGEWTNGKRNGIIYLYNGKGTYYGEYKMDKRDGYGTYVFSKNNSFYTGQWINGNMEGKGVYHIDNKRFNAGYFSKGKITELITSTEEKKSTRNTDTKKPINSTIKLIADKISKCNQEVSCLSKIYNSMAEFTSDMDDKDAGEKVMSGILAMMDAHKKGVLFDVYIAAGSKYGNHFIASAKHLSQEIRQEMSRRSEEFLKNNK
ncbi:MAG: hypothetical protein AB8B78_04515 [Polaribacter sp.]